VAGANIMVSKNGGQEHFTVGEKALRSQKIVRISNREILE
jgi:hypothetical protein